MTTARFDPWDHAHRSDPHPLYHRMRAQAPVYRAAGPYSGRGYWFLTRHRDVQEALRHPDLGRDLERLPEPLASVHRRARPAALQQLTRHLLNLDPPDHPRLRRLIAPAFGPRTVSRLQPRIRRLVDELVADLVAAGDPVDLLAGLAEPLPVTVIAELLGVPINDQGQFRGWVNDILRGRSAQVSDAANAFAGYLTGQIEQRRTAPGEDLLSQLVLAEEEGDRLTHTELLSAAFLLLVAGHETTVNLIGNGMLDLLRHPAQLERLRAEPDLTERAIEEMLRFNGPVEASVPLYALADLALGGQRIPRGELVLPVLAAANRDPAVFPEPDVFDVARRPNRHLAFGYGSHFCLGAPLARLEGALAVEALVRHFPGLALAVDPTRLEWTPGIMLRGLRELPVRLGSPGRGR